jgi:hypothetical protein
MPEAKPKADEIILSFEEAQFIVTKLEKAPYSQVYEIIGMLMSKVEEVNKLNGK